VKLLGTRVSLSEASQSTRVSLSEASQSTRV
jgi:hypothetical protein